MSTVRAIEPGDRTWVDATLAVGWGSTRVARLGQVIEAASLPGFVAEVDGRRTGLATFAERPDGLEVVTIQALIEGRGVGRSLLDRLRRHGLEVGSPRLWLVTTNDNVRAFGFYQRWGMDLVRLVVDGVAQSRRRKPSIPEVGSGGIPLRHELVFELRLGPGPIDPRPGA